MKKGLPDSEKIWRELISIARRSQRFYGKYGERYDRRLFADVQSVSRLASNLLAIGMIQTDTRYSPIIPEIEETLLQIGIDKYEEFP